MLLALLLVLALPLATPCASDSVIDARINVGGRALHAVVRPGHVPVAIVLEAGGGADLASWGEVPALLAEATGATVVAYDRASLGTSDPGPADLSPRQEVEDLRSVLDALDVPDARILVATSYGALLAMLHAGLDPDGVVALVLVDPMNPRFVQATGDFVASTVPDIDSPATERERVLVRMERTFPALIAEVGALEPGLQQPVEILTAGEAWWARPDIDAAWRDSHEAMAAAGPRRTLVVAEGSGHLVREDRPDLIVEATVRALGHVLVRRPGS